MQVGFSSVKGMNNIRLKGGADKSGVFSDVLLTRTRFGVIGRRRALFIVDVVKAWSSVAG